MTCPRCQAANPDAAKFCFNCGAPLQAPRRAEGERKVVTVLFADVVGSTALGERLDPEQLTDIINGAFALLNAAVARYGGTVARLMGDAVLALFGAPVAHEDDAERAVRAALEIREAAAEYGREIARTYGVDFSVRVGINTGLAVLTVVGDEIKTEYTAMGDTPNIAARVQAAAEPGSVVITAETHRLVRRLFDVKPLGALAVKGKTEPLELYEVLAPKAVPGTVRGLDGVRSPLVGREAEAALLREAIEAVRAGRGAFLAVVGEAGLGKSRLVAETREQATAEPVRAVEWLEGRALSYGQALSYAPWQQLLRASIGAGGDDAPPLVRDRLQAAMATCDLPAEDRPFLEAILAAESEESARALAGLDGEAVRRRLAGAVGGYLRAMANRRPAVLVFDDIHWADEASLELLLQVADLVADQPLLIVCLLRPDRDAASWRFVERVGPQLGERFTRLALEPLSTENARELLANLLHIEGLPEGVRRLILAKAEGNPFFVEEVVRALIDGGQLVRDDCRWRATSEVADVAIPDTLAGVLSARIDRLPDDPKRAAQTAAVIGRNFAYRVLDALWAEGERPSDHVEPQLAVLTRQELLRELARDPELEYAFKHALTREAAYDSLLIRRRKELHRRVGDVLAALYAERADELAPALAHHYWHGEEWDRAAEQAMRAGARAARLAALGEALEHYERACVALERLPDAPPARLIDATLAWVAVAFKLKRLVEVLPRLERAAGLARALGDRRRLALARHWTGTVQLVSGEAEAALEALLETDQLAEQLGDERLSIVPRFFLTFSLLDHEPRANLPLLEAVIRAAHDRGSVALEAHARGTKAMAHARLGEADRAEEELVRARAVVRGSGSVVKVGEVDILSAMTYLELGDWERALAYGEPGTAALRTHGALECTSVGYFCVGLGQLQVGRADEALESLEESVAFDQRSNMRDLTNRPRAGRALARYFAGREGALAELERAAAEAEAGGDEWAAAMLAPALADAYARVGELGRAEQRLTAASEYYGRNGMTAGHTQTLQALAQLRGDGIRSAETQQAIAGPED